MNFKNFLIVASTAIILVVAGCSRTGDKAPNAVFNPPTNPTVSDNPFDTAQNSGQRPGTEPVATAACYSLNVPFYSQNDPNWKNDKLGYSNYWTIGNSGCYLACVSMLYARWGYYNMNPKTLNAWSYNGKAHYAFYDGTPYINPVTAIEYPGVCRNVRTITKSRDAIINELAAGHPVIASTTWYGGHFVVIFGWDGYQFWVKDPVKDWTAQNRPLGASLSDVNYVKVLGG